MVTQLLVNGIVVGCIYALVAIGLGLTYRTGKFINFGYAAVFAVAPYSAYAVLSTTSSPAWLATIIGIGTAALIGSVCYLLVYQPLRQHGADTLTLLLASIGLFLAIEGSLALFFGSETKIFPGDRVVKEGVAIFGARITTAQIILVASSVIVTACWWATNRLTSIGLVLRSVTNDEHLAEIVGVRTNWVIHLGFIASCSTVAIAGILQGLDTGMTPMMGFNVFLVAVVALVIGGGGVVMDAAAAIVLGIVQQFSILILPAHWQDAIVFFVLIFFLLVRPQGFLGNPLRKVAV